MSYLLTSGRKNALINGGFNVWQRGTGAVSAAPGVNTFSTDRWFVNPTGAAVTVGQGLPYLNSTASLGITGAVGATLVNAGQRIESILIQKFRQTCTFSAWVFNGTGAPFTPILVGRTPTASDNYTATLGVLSAALQSCADNAWTKVTWTGDISAFASIAYGLELNVQFPTGALDNGAKYVYLTQSQLERGPFTTEFEIYDPESEFLACARYFEVLGGASAYETFGIGVVINSTHCLGTLYFTPKRAAPTITSSAYTNFAVVSNSGTLIAASAANVFTTPGLRSATWNATVAAGLTAGNSTQFQANNSVNAVININAEL